MTLQSEYYIGDLCYVLNRETWDELCQYMFPNDGGDIQGLFKLKDGRSLYLYRTAWGDGCYYDQDDREYGVDSGSLGCMLVKELDEPENVYLGHLHKMPPPICYSNGEVLTFGHIKIDTDF